MSCCPPAGLYNIIADQGATLSRTVTWKDSAKNPINITGYTARMHVRELVTSASTVLELTTENNRITLGGTAGTITLTVSAPKLVLMGDFNITVDDRDVWDPVALKDTIHCTVEERAHFQALIDLGTHDAFRLFEQPEKSYSWWDYREFAFRRNRGLRIDHILVSDALKDSVQACVIDKAPRKNERPSDHTPVVVTLG